MNANRPGYSKLFLALALAAMASFSLPSLAATTSNVKPTDSAGFPTNYAPRLPSGLTTYYIDQDIMSSPVPADYRSLPDCNPSPQCSDIGSTYPPTIAPTGYTPTTQFINAVCPRLCKTSRLVSENQAYPNGSGRPVVTTVTSYTHAVCPKGYAQVAAANPKHNIVYNTTPVSTGWITDEATYTFYRDHGYTCIEQNLGFSSPYCSYKSPNSNPVCIESTMANQAWGSVSVVLKYSVMPNGYVGRFIDPCTFPATCHPPGDCNASPIACDNNPHAEFYKNHYVNVSCTPPAGYYYTAEFAPATLICARINETWQQRY